MGTSSIARVVLITISCLIFSAGCGGGPGLLTGDANPGQTAASASPNLIDAGRTSSGFTLGILPDTYLGGDPAGEFTVAEARDGDETIITISVSGAEDLRACYGSLAYDAARFTPITVDQLPLVAEGEGEILTLSNTATPGTVGFGQVLAGCDERDGLSGDAVVAELRFRDGTYTGARSVSGVPTSEEEQPWLVINLTNMRLDWSYYMRGDYNQDGLIGMGDLTPIGRHYGEQHRVLPQFPITPWDEGTALWIIDGNNDGEIGIQDITVIGQKYGRAVTGYNLYRGTSSTDGYPGSATATSPGQPVGFIPFSEVKGGAGGEMRYFRFPAPFLTGDSWYWLRPTDGDSEGIASNPACLVDVSNAGFSLDFHEELSEPIASFDEAWLEYSNDGQLIVDIWLRNPANITYLVADLGIDGDRFDPWYSWFDPSQTYSILPTTSAIGCDEYPDLVKVFSLHWGEVSADQTTDWLVSRIRFEHNEQQFTEGMLPLADNFGHFMAMAEYNPSTSELTWYYCIAGDLNQDGVVYGTDTLQLGRFFESTTGTDFVCFDPCSMEYVVDCNSDGYIGPSDISIIGQTYLNAVTGYNIYYTDDPDYPGFSILDAYGWELTGAETLLGHVDLADAVNNRFEERLKFTYTIADPVPGRCYWAAPELNGTAQYVPGESVIQIPEE